MSDRSAWLIETIEQPTRYFVDDGDWCDNPSHAFRFSTKPGWVRPPMPKSADRISGILDKTTGTTTHTCACRKTGKRWRLDPLARMTSVGLEVKPRWVPMKAGEEQ